MSDRKNDFDKQREIDEFFEQFDDDLSYDHRQIKDDVNSRFDKLSDKFERSVNERNEKRNGKESYDEFLNDDFDQPGMWNEPDSYEQTSKETKVNYRPMKKKKKNSNEKSKFKRPVIKVLLSLFLVGFLSSCIVLGIVVTTAPEINAKSIYETLGENSVLYDDKGKEVDSVMTTQGLRTNIKYDQMPKNLVNAFIAVEDKTFWKHHGFNMVRIMGAVVDSLRNNGRIKGTSTITQQLARNIYLTDTKGDYSLVRKVKEAYYAVVIERELTKKQIIEAYANTIYLGFHSNGVQAASQEYFSKDVSELNLQECAAIASLPQSPHRFALVKLYNNEDIQENNPNIIVRTGDFTLVYNDAVESRKNLVLKNMYDQGKISKQEYLDAKNAKLRDSIKPNLENIQTKSSYFADYVLDKVAKDLMEKYKISRDEARNMIYNNGLKIHSTMDSKAQQTVEKAFSNSANFPSVSAIKKDRLGNVIGDNGKVLLYSESYYFDKNGNFVFPEGSYRYLDNGDLLLKKGNKLNFYTTHYAGLTDYSIEFKNMYSIEGGSFYSTQGGVVNIPQDSKSLSSDGDLIVKSSFLKKKPNFFRSNGSTLYLGPETYTLRQKIRQPQGAMVIMDHSNGEIKAMVGGRNTTGKSLYNRAINPRQPGSSIKPICVYGPALQSAVDKLNGKGNGGHTGASHEPRAKLGEYWTPVSVIKDSPIEKNGKQWPKNWYPGYKGEMSMRTAVEQSVNTIAVKVMMEVGKDASVAFAEKLGITSIVKSGAVNDMNAASLALGGMSRGISPLEMAAAYGTFADKGTYREPIAYTKVLNRKGEVILENESESRKVMDPGAAFIMSDILRTTVSNGIASSAQIGVQTVYGKTGTTTDNFDAWFVGFTPTYSAALWIGNDVNIQLSTGSGAAARLWSNIMRQVCAGLPNKQMKVPDNVVVANVGNGQTDCFIKGTQSMLNIAPETEDVEICSDSGYLCTPWCTNREIKAFEKGTAPQYYCPIHNQDTVTYPINPALLNTVKPTENNNDSGSSGSSGTNGDTSPQPANPAAPVSP